MGGESCAFNFQPVAVQLVDQELDKAARAYDVQRRFAIIVGYA